MRTTSAADVAAMAGARLVAGDPATEVRGVCVDSRLVASGDLFVALEGATRHGAEFAADALDRGAAAVLVSDTDEVLSKLRPTRADAGADAPEPGLGAGRPAVMAAEDTLAALQTLAAAYREGLRATVVGITGSTGKTTTKDLVAAALAPAMRVVASEKSHNNEIGLPLTLLAADDETDVVVAEMAMRGTGQIAQLAGIARPQVGVITNVGVTHFELLGSEDAIADAKSELLAALPADGLAVLNGDDRYSERMAATTGAKVVRYGLGADNDLVGSDVGVDEDGRVRFTASNGVGSVPVALPMLGRHNVYNALAALAVARRLGVALDAAAEGLAAARLSPMRMDLFMTADGVSVINDCYNANPTSVIAALDVLAELPAAGRRVAILGEMLELGPRSREEHLAVGDRVVETGVDLLVTVGDGARPIAERALLLGLAPSAWHAFDDADAAARAAVELLAPGDVVLVKGSRAIGLERVVEAVAGQG